MTKLFALVFALLVPSSASPIQRAVWSSTPRRAHAKPLGDQLAEMAWLVALRAAQGLRASLGDLVASLQGWAAWAVDAECPEPATAPLLGASIGSAAPVPPALARIRGTAGAAARGLIDHVEAKFAPQWADPQHARMASGLFIGSLALACAGLVGVVTVAAPVPPMHLQRLAGAVTAGAAGGPAALVAAPAPAAPPDAGDEAAAPAAPPPDTAPVTKPAAPAPLPPIPPAARGALPIGKGMWIWMEERADGGDPNAIVARAKAYGLTHLYVRTGTLKGGFIGGPFLDRLLPVAHAKGIRVYGWDFPYLFHPGNDVNRAMAAIRHTTPDGHRIDGFSADIESTREGTNNDIAYVNAYVTGLRGSAGPDYPLIATIPNPTPTKIATGFPYAAIVPTFDAVAPMVYWMNRDPGSDVANAITYLSQFGKPVFPIGQAYDGGPEGGPAGPPGRDAMIRFMQFADAAGAAGVSFWSYQHATQEAWDAVRDADEFRLELGGAQGLSPGMIRSYQTVLTGLGFPVVADGLWGQATIDAVNAYQTAARLPVTGVIDEATRAFLLAPVAAPIAHP